MIGVGEAVQSPQVIKNGKGIRGTEWKGDCVGEQAHKIPRPRSILPDATLGNIQRRPASGAGSTIYSILSYWTLGGIST